MISYLSHFQFVSDAIERLRPVQRLVFALACAEMQIANYANLCDAGEKLEVLRSAVDRIWSTLFGESLDRKLVEADRRELEMLAPDLAEDDAAEAPSLLYVVDGIDSLLEHYMTGGVGSALLIAKSVVNTIDAHLIYLMAPNEVLIGARLEEVTQDVWTHPVTQREIERQRNLLRRLSQVDVPTAELFHQWKDEAMQVASSFAIRAT